MKSTRWLTAVAALVLSLTVPALVLAESESAFPGTSRTVQEMLVTAIQDEYEAQAEYTALLAAFPAETRLAALIKAENAHITLLAALLDTYGYEVPENQAAGQVTVPATLAEAYAAGIKAEAENMAMYEAFLGQQDLPDNLKKAFTTLQTASQRHLNAFVRAMERDGTGARMNRRLNDRRGNMQNGSGACPICGASLGTGRGNR